MPNILKMYSTVVVQMFFGGFPRNQKKKCTVGELDEHDDVDDWSSSSFTLHMMKGAVTPPSVLWKCQRSCSLAAAPTAKHI